MIDWTKSTHAIDARGNEVRVEYLLTDEDGVYQFFRILDAAYFDPDGIAQMADRLSFSDGVWNGYKDFKLIPPAQEWQYKEADKRVDDGDYRGLAAALIAKYEEEPLEPAAVAYNNAYEGDVTYPWDQLSRSSKDFYRHIYEAGKKDAG